MSPHVWDTNAHVTQVDPRAAGHQSSTVPLDETQLPHTFQKFHCKKVELGLSKHLQEVHAFHWGAFSEPNFSTLHTSKLPGPQSSPMVPLSRPSPGQAGVRPLVSRSWVLAEWPEICDKWLGRLSGGTWL